MMKRIFDISVATVGLVILSPLLVLIAVLIKLDSQGSVFFRQVRIGRRRQPFRIYKFRTMIPDAPCTGGLITVGEDPRITRIGRWLRKTKLDELPQLLNVVKGEMSFVGPRPEVPHYVELFHKDYEEILQVAPGITDLASLAYHNEAELLGKAEDPEKEYVHHILPEKIRLAKEYVHRSSLRFDLLVILKTLWRISRRQNIDTPVSG
jgi:lipopolysaccharide/colanic/teichoic acid biosynthesis glycosyltransferase